MTDLLQAAKEVIRQISVEHLSENAVESLRQAINEAENAKQEPVAWMWACTECGTEAEDGTDCRICSSCGYHKFYKAPKVATCVCAAKTQEKVKQEPVTTDLMDMLRLIETIKYLRGIAERGLGREIRDDETIEQFVLGYVKQLEAAIRATRAQEQAEQEPVKIFFNLALRKMWSGTEIQSWIDSLPPLYAAPVRTKDLTEAEIDDILEKHSGGNLGFAYAAIAADREKNRE